MAKLSSIRAGVWNLPLIVKHKKLQKTPLNAVYLPMIAAMVGVAPLLIQKIKKNLASLPISRLSILFIRLKSPKSILAMALMRSWKTVLRLKCLGQTCAGRHCTIAIPTQHLSPTTSSICMILCMSHQMLTTPAGAWCKFQPLKAA